MGPGPLDSDESDLDTEPLVPQPNPSQPRWDLSGSRNSDVGEPDLEGDDDDDEESYEDYVSDVVLQLGAGDHTISSDTEVEASEEELEDEPEDESEDEPEDEPEDELENQPSPRLDGGRRGVQVRPAGPVRRNLGPEFELQPPGDARPPPVNVNGYNVGIRGPVLPRPQQLQPPPQQQRPQLQLPPQQQQQQPRPPNQPRPELQPQGRHRSVREQMTELLGYVTVKISLAS